MPQSDRPRYLAASFRGVSRGLGGLFRFQSNIWLGPTLEQNGRKGYDIKKMSDDSENPPLSTLEDFCGEPAIPNLSNSDSYHSRHVTDRQECLASLFSESLNQWVWKEVRRKQAEVDPFLRKCHFQ